MLRKFKKKVNDDLHLKELLKGSSISFTLKIIGMGFGYIFTLLITRNYGAEVTGIYALSLVVLQIASIIGRLGMDRAILRFVAEYNSQNKKDMINEIYKKIIKLIIPISLFVSLVMFFLSPYVANYFFHKNYLINYFRIISIGIVPYVLFSINSESLRGLKKIKEYAFLQNIGIFFTASIFLGLSLFIIKNNYIPVIVYVTSVFLMSLLSCFLWFKKFNSLNLSVSPVTHQYFDFALKKVPEILTFPAIFYSPFSSDYAANVTSYKYILLVSSPMLITGSLGLILGFIDIIILGIFKTSSEVGIYSVVVKLSLITVMILAAINVVAAPKFAEFWSKGDKKGLTKIAQQSTKIVFWLSLPVLLIFLVFPSYILEIFGAKFETGVMALIMLVFGQFINAISGSVGYILQMTGFQLYVQNTTIASVIINIILNLLLVPKYSINGAAFASMVTLIFWNLIMGMKVKSILGEWVFYRPYRLHL